MLLSKLLSRTTFDSYADFKKNYELHVPEKFNFARDVVDAWAQADETKRALVWLNDSGERREFTFKEISDLSKKGILMTDELGNETVTLSQDGKKLFYIEEDDSALYVRDVNGKKDPTKIDTNVGKYVVNDKANLVTYIKNDGADVILCQKEVGGDERKKISDKVSEFYVTRDGKKAIYLTSEGDLYPVAKQEKGDKISGSVSEIVKVSKDLSEVYYLKEGALYLKDGKNNEKIAKDVYDVVAIYDSGEFYYVKHVEEEKTEEGNNFYDEQGNLDVDKYVENYIKQSGYVGYELIYNDGKNDTKIADISSYSASAAADKAVVSYSVVDVKTSDITQENLYEKLQEIGKDSKCYIAIEAKAYEVEDAEDVYLLSSGKKALILKDRNEEKSTYAVSTIEISKKLGKESKVDEDVYNMIAVTEEGNLFYLKDYNEEKTKADLYVDGKKIEEDVYASYRGFELLEDSNKLLYYVDYNTEKGKGELKCATTKGKNNKIDVDVYDVSIAPNEQILYLKDKSSSGKGTLCISTNGKEGKKLDDDVKYILSYYNYTTRNNEFLGYED